MAGIWSRVGDAFSHIFNDTPYRARMTAVDDDTGWKRATDQLGGDMVGGSPDIQNRASVVQTVRRIMKKNPFLYRDYVYPVVAAVVGGSGIKAKAKGTDPEGPLQKILDEFYKRNAMSVKFQAFLCGLLQTEGELILPIAVNRSTGSMKFTYVYSDMVEVEWSPDDNRLINFLTVELPQGTSDQVGRKETRKFLPVLDITDKDAIFKGRMGDDGGVGVNVGLGPEYAVYVKCNDLVSRRGLPPLYTMVDLADLLDQFLYQRLKLLETIMRMWVDVSVEGSPKQVEDLAAKYRSIPANGCADVHNSKVTVATKKFDIDGAEVGSDWDTFLAGWGLATNIPTEVLLGKQMVQEGSLYYKFMQQEQENFGEALRILLDTQIAAKVAAGQLSKEDADEGYELVFPEISTKDVGKLATAINQIALALMVGRQENWISGETAAKAYVEAVEMALDTGMKAEDGESDEPAMPQVLPGGGGPQSGQAGAFDKFTRKGQQINNATRSKVTRA